MTEVRGQQWGMFGDKTTGKKKPALNKGLSSFNNDKFAQQHLYLELNLCIGCRYYYYVSCHVVLRHFSLECAVYRTHFKWIIMKLEHFRQSRPFFLCPLDCFIFSRLLFILANKNIDHYPLYFWHKLNNPK